jgi:hypothetical protein
MATQDSSLDRVNEHLQRHGAGVPAPDALKPDLALLRKRAEFARRLGHPVVLSPYMVALMRLDDRM